jgi:class 3 adenylate cyclase
VSLKRFGSAIELQKLSTTAKIPLRIGIHMGEMIEKHDDVYGDAVNVASRIQALGISGSILVSKTVIEELKNHPTIILNH